MLPILFHYYGIDLVATGFTLVGIYQLGNKQRVGFITGLAGNVLWLVFSVWSSSLGLLLANVVIAALNVRGYRNWKRDEQ